MANDMYRAPASRVSDPPPHRVSLRSAPLRVKIAIILSWLVLAVDFLNGFWQIYADPEASSDLQFKSIWAGVALISAVITALFIFQASQRRNWGLIGLLVWTLGSWCLWIYPQGLSDYTSWKWVVAVTLIAVEVAALVLLFGGQSSQWYSSATRGSASAP